MNTFITLGKEYFEKYLANTFWFTLFILLLIWLLLPGLLQSYDHQVALPDSGIWILIAISFISFLLALGLCFLLVQNFWQRLGLPKLKIMVSQFYTLTLWQQLGFYWASFALLLLSSLLALSAVL